MKYRLIDHTADFRVHVFGLTPDGLFANAAYAMFDQITNLDKLKGMDSQVLEATGTDWPDLMINWLRELLYLWTGKEKLVKTVDISSINESMISTNILFDNYMPGQHVIKNEIKAVTYHRLHVDKGPSGWEAKIIFDV
jgi:SHS2 domain-containing protein